MSVNAMKKVKVKALYAGWVGEDKKWALGDVIGIFLSFGKPVVLPSLEFSRDRRGQKELNVRPRPAEKTDSTTIEEVKAFFEEEAKKKSLEVLGFYEADFEVEVGEKEEETRLWWFCVRTSVDSLSSPKDYPRKLFWSPVMDFRPEIAYVFEEEVYVDFIQSVKVPTALFFLDQTVSSMQTKKKRRIL